MSYQVAGHQESDARQLPPIISSPRAEYEQSPPSGQERGLMIKCQEGWGMGGSHRTQLPIVVVRFLIGAQERSNVKGPHPTPLQGG